MEEKEEGLSFSELFHVIFIRKWLLLSISLIVMLIGMMAIIFVYNPRNVEYKMTFQIKFPDELSTSNNQRFYPDGTEFLYQEFISLDYLQRAKDSNEMFSSIDIEKMKYSNHISIEEYEAVINNTTIKTQTYSIYIMKKYFSSDSQAINFFKALANVPAEMIIEKSRAIDYNKNLNKYDLVKDYSAKIDLLIAQKELIVEEYEKLISKYSTSQEIYLNDDSKISISYAISEVEAYFTQYDLDGLLVEVEENGYVDSANTEYYENIENKRRTLLREKEINDAKISNLKKEYKDLISLSGSSTIVIQDIMGSIDKLATRNAEIDYTIDNVYDKILNNRDNLANDSEYQAALTSFAERLVGVYNKTVEFTDILKAFKVNSYEQNTKVLISAGSIITAQGGFSVGGAFFVFLLSGFLVGAIVNLSLDMPPYLRKKRNKEVSE